MAKLRPRPDGLDAVRARAVAPERDRGRTAEVGLTPLMMAQVPPGAAFRNYLPILQYLVEHGAKLDAKNKIGWTPLMEARWSGRGLLATRPEAEAFLRKQYEAQCLPVILPTREEAIEKLYNN